MNVLIDPAVSGEGLRQQEWIARAVKTIDGGLALSVNQGDFDVALQRGERERNLPQQSGKILRHHLQQR